MDYNNLISVIIPAYNCESTITKTINSVKEQTYSNYEVIIVENGSTDCTISAIKNSIEGDIRFKLHVLPNSNVCAARNEGFKQSTGSFITYLDADDIMHPDKLRLQLNNLTNNPKCIASLCWTNYIDVNDNLLYKGPQLNYTGNLVEHLLIYSLSCGSVPLIKKEYVTLTGNWDTFLPSSNDWDYWFRLSLQGNFCYVPQYLISYRQTPNSISQNLESKCKYIFQVLNNNFSLAPAKYNKLKHVAQSNVWFYLAQLYHERGATYTIKRNVLLCLYNSFKYNYKSCLNTSYLKLLIKSILYYPYSLYEKQT